MFNPAHCRAAPFSVRFACALQEVDRGVERTSRRRTYAKVAAAFTDVWAAAGAGDGLTYPSEGPRKRIDYLFVRPIHTVPV